MERFGFGGFPSPVPPLFLRFLVSPLCDFHLGHNTRDGRHEASLHGQKTPTGDSNATLILQLVGYPHCMTAIYVSLAPSRFLYALTCRAPSRDLSDFHATLDACLAPLDHNLSRYSSHHALPSVPSPWQSDGVPNVIVDAYGVFSVGGWVGMGGGVAAPPPGGCILLLITESWIWSYLPVFFSLKPNCDV